MKDKEKLINDNLDSINSAKPESAKSDYEEKIRHMTKKPSVMNKAGFLKILSERIIKSKNNDKEVNLTNNIDTNKSKLMSLLFKGDSKVLQILNPEEYYLSIKSDLSNKGIFKHIKDKDHNIFKVDSDNTNKIDFDYLQKNNVNFSKINYKDLRTVYNRKYDKKKEVSKPPDTIRKIKYENVNEINNRFNKAKSTASKTCYYEYNNDELVKHRYLLGKCLVYHSNYLNNMSNINTQDNKVEPEKPEEIVKKNALFSYYQLPETNIPQTSRTLIKLGKIKSELRKNTSMSYYNKADSTIQSENDGRSKSIISHSRNHDKYKQINKIHQLNSRINFNNATDSLLVNEYLANEVDKISHTIEVKKIIDKIDDIDTINKNLDKFKNIKVYDMNDAINGNFTKDEQQGQDEDIILNDNNYHYDGPLNTSLLKKDFETMFARNSFYDLNTIFLISRIIPIVTKPCVRMYCTMNIIKGKLYLFGGNSTKKLNDLWEYNFHGSKKWKYIIPKGTPPDSRFGHTAVGFNTEIFIYGGITNVEVVRDHMIIYDTINNCYFTEKVQNIELAKWRSYHIAHQAGTFMIIYGGISQSNKYLSDVMLFDLKSLKWYEVSISNQKEDNGIAFHSSAMVIPKAILENLAFHIYHFPDDFNFKNKKNKIKHEGIYIFGGIEYDSQTGSYSYCNEIKILKLGNRPLSWIYPKCKGVSPESRASCSSNYFEELCLLVVYGGYNKNKVFNDLFLLDLIYLNWVKVDIIGKDLPRRQAHCSIINDGHLYIFGGAGISKFEGADLIEVDLDIFSHSIPKDEIIDYKKKKSTAEDSNSSKKHKLSRYEFVKSLARRVINHIPVDIDLELKTYDRQGKKSKKSFNNAMSALSDLSISTDKDKDSKNMNDEIPLFNFA